MDVAVFAVFCLFGLPVLAVFGTGLIVVSLRHREKMRRIDQRQRELDARLEQRLERLERRMANLETIVLDRERCAPYDNLESCGTGRHART